MTEQATEDPDTRAGALKRAARLAGRVLMLAAFAFLVWEIYRQWGRVSGWRPTPVQLAVLAGLCLLHGAALFIQARNWLTLVGALVPAPPPVPAVLRSFTETQIAKYVPGNVMHFVGRHFYLKDYGVAHKPIVTATLLEIAGLPVAAVTAICLLAPFADWSGAGYGGAAWAPYLPAVAVIALGICTLVALWSGYRAILRPAAVVLGRAILFMILQAAMFAATLWIIGGEFVALALPLAILSWLMGFLTPGAPGGMGVREALLVSLLGQAVAADVVLIAALLFRIITTVGDVVLFGAGRLFLRLPPRPDPPL
jgi:hypothetical protein